MKPHPAIDEFNPDFTPSLVSPSVPPGILPPGVPLKLGIMASGTGSNFEAVAQAIKDGQLNAQIQVLIYNNPEAKVTTIHQPQTWKDLNPVDSGCHLAPPSKSERCFKNKNTLNMRKDELNFWMPKLC